MRRGPRANLSRISGVFAWAAALWSAPALAAPEATATPPIVIQVAQRPDRLLDEAVLRIQGELAAMGLEASVTAASAPTDAAAGEPSATNAGPRSGRLTLAHDGYLVRISAVGPSSPSTFEQELDTRAPEVTAEVVAVRAVEALRAVMTLPERRAEKPPPKPVTPPPPPPPEPPNPPSKETSSAGSLAPPERSTLSLAAGAQGFFDGPLASPGWGGELGVFWGRSSLFAGVTGSLTLSHASMSADEGDVDVRRSNVFARIGYALRLAGPFEASFAAGVGLSHYQIDGHGDAGFVGMSLARSTPAALLALGLNAWFSQHFAAYVRVDATFSSDAPEVRSNFRALGVLDRPALWASAGLIVRLPRPLSQ